MAEDIKGIDMPFHVIVMLDSKESFYSGHFDKETAQARCNQLNKQATELGIKARYVVKENIPKVE